VLFKNICVGKVELGVEENWTKDLNILVSFTLTDMKKEKNILQLFFNEPTKHWHFEEILDAARISRPQAVLWLKKGVREKIIKRIKPRRRQSYYCAYYQNAKYQIKKRLFALEMLENVGFLSHLNALPNVKTVILFGSLNRWDWHSNSDIDVFIYGDPAGLELYKYRIVLHREIEMFICIDEKELYEFNPALLHNVAEGYIIKGNLDFMQVRV